MNVTPFASNMGSESVLEPVILFFGAAELDRKWHNDGLVSPYNRLYLVESGEAFLWTKDQRITMRPGMAYLIPTGLQVGFRCDSAMQKLFFHFKLLKPDRYDLLSGFSGIGELPVSRELLQQLRLHGSGRSFADSMEVKYLLFQLLTLLQRRYGFGTEPLPAYSQHVTDTIRYIRENLSADLCVEELARRRFISRSFLADRFRKEVGIPIGKYIDDQLMTAAQWQLSQTDDSLMEISRKLGYSDQCYFSRRFKQLCGVTPQQYRKRSKP